MNDNNWIIVVVFKIHILTSEVNIPTSLEHFQDHVTQTDHYQ